jgi:dihydrofolate reductase
MRFDPTAPVRGAIVAMNHDNVIGLAGKIPWHHSGDLKRFKQRTMGATIVMGRLTWESIGSKPLPGRRNIVISRNPVANTECYTDIGTATRACQDGDTWVIGGGQVYAAAMDWLTLLDVTYVPDIIDDPGAVRFPVIDPELWRESSTSLLEDSPLRNVIYHHR